MGDGERDVFKVVFPRADQSEGIASRVVSGAILGGEQEWFFVGGTTDAQCVLKKRAGCRGDAGDGFGCAFGDDATAGGTRFGADFDEPVGGFEDVKIVLDDDHAVAVIDKRLENFDEAFDVVAVKAGSRLVEE